MLRYAVICVVLACVVALAPGRLGAGEAWATQLGAETCGGTGDLTTDWTVITGFELPQQTGGLCQPKTVGVTAAALYTGAAWPDNQAAEMQIVTALTNSSRLVSISLRGTTTTRTQYECVVFGPIGGSTIVRIYEFNAGVGVILVSNNAVVVSGDTLKCSVLDNVIKLYINGVERATYTDATPIASGTPGMVVSTGAGTTADVRVDGWTGTSGPENHYIRSGASGTATGADWTNAYASVPATLIRGDTYYIADGAYSGYTFDDVAIGTHVITLKKAVAADHGTETGWNGTYGDGQAAFSGEFDFTTDYWLIDGVVGGGAATSWEQGGFGFKVTETNDSLAILRMGWTGTGSHVTVRHVDLQGKGSVSTQGGSFSNDGLAVYGQSDITLSHFWMHGSGRTHFFMSPGGDVTITHGRLDKYYGSPSVHSEVASIWEFSGPIIGTTTLSYNLFTHIVSTGGIMWGNETNATARLDVYGNVFYKADDDTTWENTANGLIGGFTVRACRNMRIYNNSFIGINGTRVFTDFLDISSDNIASNNLFYNVSANIGYSDIQTHDYNHYINSGTTQGEASGTTSIGDPFVNYVALDFGLVAASGPVDKGVPLGAPYDTDALGVSRTEGATYDAGAYELTQGGSSNPPPPPPQPPPAGGGFFQASERPAAGFRPAAGARTPR